MSKEEFWRFKLRKLGITTTRILLFSAVVTLLMLLIGRLS